MKFGMKIKELRENQNISQADLAKRLKVGVATVGMWESSQRTPGAKRLNEVASYFNVSIDYLIGGEVKAVQKRPASEINDPRLNEYMRLFNMLNAEQKARAIGYLIAMLEDSGTNIKTIL